MGVALLAGITLTTFVAFVPIVVVLPLKKLCLFPQNTRSKHSVYHRISMFNTVSAAEEDRGWPLSQRIPIQRLLKGPGFPGGRDTIYDTVNAVAPRSAQSDL